MWPHSQRRKTTYCPNSSESLSILRSRIRILYKNTVTRDTARMTKPAQRREERHHFERLAVALRLPIVPGSISQPDPPAPDITCALADGSRYGAELVAIDQAATQKRIADMGRVAQAWEHALRSWSVAEQKQVRSAFDDVYLSVILSQALDARGCTAVLREIQRAALGMPTHFEGDIFDPVDLPIGIDSARVLRGAPRGGPHITRPTADFLHPPQLDLITRKLTAKSYTWDGTLELFVYTQHDDIDAQAGKLEEVREVIQRDIVRSRFGRVHVFDAFPGKHLLTEPSGP